MSSVIRPVWGQTTFEVEQFRTSGRVGCSTFEIVRLQKWSDPVQLRRDIAAVAGRARRGGGLRVVPRDRRRADAQSGQHQLAALGGLAPAPAGLALFPQRPLD